MKVGAFTPKNMKRKYPLFIIDRSKSENYPNDYIVCLNREVGFVAQIIFLPKNDMYKSFIENFQKIENYEIAGVHYPFHRGGGVVLQVVEFLHYFDIDGKTTKRIQSLLRKALKKYLHTESNRTAHGDLGIDNQIKQMELNLEHTLNNYNKLIERTESKEYADYLIGITKETIQTLKNNRDNMKYWTTILN